MAVATGERLGLIRFGSRTDVYLPADWAPLVVKGQRVIGGETPRLRLASVNGRQVAGALTR